MATGKINEIPRYTKNIINADWINSGKLEAYGNVRTVHLILKNNTTYAAGQPYILYTLDEEDTPKNSFSADMALYQGGSYRVDINSVSRRIVLYMPSNVTITNAAVFFSYIV